MISEIQKQRIIDYLKIGNRLDGRKFDEHREIEVRMNISDNAEGSCAVKFGKTEVYCGIKLDVVEPYPDSPDKGSLMTTVELSPIASPDFETGPPSIKAIELGRVIDRGLRESGFLDFSKLVIKEGEKVWNVFVDFYAVNDAGNLMDAASLAAVIALMNAKMPKYDEKTGKVDRESKLTTQNVPLNKDCLAVNITFYKIGESIVLDPVKEEQESIDYRVSIGVGINGKDVFINSMQKGEKHPISSEDMEKILNILESKSKEILDIVKKNTPK